MWRIATKVPILTLRDGRLLVGGAVWRDGKWTISPLWMLTCAENACFVPWHDGLGYWFARAVDGLVVAMVNDQPKMSVRHIRAEIRENAPSFPTPVGAFLAGAWIHNAVPTPLPPAVDPVDITAIGQDGEIYVQGGRVFRRGLSEWKEELVNPRDLTVFWSEPGLLAGLHGRKFVVVNTISRLTASWAPPHEGDVLVACAPASRWSVAWAGPDRTTVLVGWETKLLRGLSWRVRPDAMVPIRESWVMVCGDHLLIVPENPNSPVRRIWAGPLLHGWQDLGEYRVWQSDGETLVLGAGTEVEAPAEIVDVEPFNGEVSLGEAEAASS